MFSKRVLSSPLAVQLSLTKKCNLNCYYCSAYELVEKENGIELNTDEWRNLLDRLRELEVLRIDFTGGEVFLRNDIFQILEKAVKCKFPKMRLVTNGTLISKEIASKLKDLNFKNIELSLDGDEEIHDHIRGRGSFSKSTVGIKYLIDFGIIPIIRFTPMKTNFQRLNNMVDILYPLGIKDIRFNSLNIGGRAKKNYKKFILNFSDLDEFKKIIENIKKKYNNIEIDSPSDFYQSLPKQYLKHKLSNSIAKIQSLKPCSAAHSSCFVTSCGWVLPCSEFYSFKGGNIRNKDFLEIWRDSENFKKIRNLSSIFVDKVPYCKDCDYRIFCSAGCRANAYFIYNDLISPDPLCPYIDIGKEEQDKK